MSDSSTVNELQEEVRRNASSPERSAIADAVAARLMLQASKGSEADETKQRGAHLIKVRRLINDMSGAVSYERAFGCLQLMHTLINNIVERPDEEKYRSFRASQPKIAREILSLPLAPALLIEAGFRKRTTAFQEEWYVPAAEQWAITSLGMRRLAWTRDVIGERMAEYREASDRVQMQQERERTTEKHRKARALAEAQEDRERVALRSQREKAARAAAEERTKEQEAVAAAAAAAGESGAAQEQMEG